jgi:hypothetical protein
VQCIFLKVPPGEEIQLLSNVKNLNFVLIRRASRCFVEFVHTRTIHLFEGGTDTPWTLRGQNTASMRYLILASTNLNLGKFYLGENRNNSHGQ